MRTNSYYRSERFGRGDPTVTRYTVWMNQLLLEDLANGDKAAAAARAREVLAALSGRRYAGGRGQIFAEFVAPTAASQEQAALDRLATAMLASKEDSPDIFLVLGEY